MSDEKTFIRITTTGNQSKNEYRLYTNKKISPVEYAELMASVGWGVRQDYDQDKIKKSIESYPFVAHIRNHEGQLVGYVSAFSDGAFSTFISELVVHPHHQGIGLGSKLLNAVEKRFEGVPIYAIVLASEKEFFIRQGYARPKRELIVVTKRNRKGRR